MLLSIIIPVYNVEHFIEKCVRSCENQDIPHAEYELIIINDGSKDNSLRVVEHIAQDYNNIRIFSQDNAGLSAARNRGMQEAQGEYYMFVDSDDWIADNCLGKLTFKLKSEHPDALAICAANVINDTPKRRKSYLDETPITGRDLLLRGVEPCAPFSIWRAAFFKKHHLTFFEGIFHEDSEFTPRAYYLAEKVSFINDIIYYVYQNPNSITRTVNPKKSFDLINVVCTHLYDFAQSVEDKYKTCFYNMVALYVNNALHGICYCSQEKQKELNDILFMHPELYQGMLLSSISKYRFEGKLFRMFPKHPLFIYKLLQKFNTGK